MENYEYEERAAIHEYEAGFSRLVAERMAREAQELKGETERNYVFTFGN